jgi:hypothetical protein
MGTRIELDHILSLSPPARCDTIVRATLQELTYEALLDLHGSVRACNSADVLLQQGFVISDFSLSLSLCVSVLLSLKPDAAEIGGLGQAGVSSYA